MRLATWNVNSLTARLPRVTEWMVQRAGRALPAGDQAGGRQIPVGRLLRPGIRICPPRRRAVERGGPPQPGRAGRGGAGVGLARRRARLPDCGGDVRGVRVHSVYVPNGRSLDNEFYAVKLQWLARLRAMLDERYQRGTRWLSAATSTWRRRRRRVGPGPVRRSDPCEPAERAALADVQAWGSTTCSDSSTSRASSAGGTTGPAPSTRVTACALTWSWSVTTWPPAPRAPLSTGTPARARSPRTDARRSWSTSATGPA